MLQNQFQVLSSPFKTTTTKTKRRILMVYLHKLKNAYIVIKIKHPICLWFYLLGS